MISKFPVLEKYLNYFLLFIFPTQLALHFWPDFAFIYGVRVDYLSPTIYLTDIVFVSLFLNWFIGNSKAVFKDIYKNRMSLLLLVLFMLLNISLSSVFTIALIKWLRIIEIICLAYYVEKRRDVFSKTVVSRILFFSLVIFCLIGLAQFVVGKTSGGLFYWLGERSFSVYTPGISLANILGRNYLRIYSTFPHPNSFAGFVGIATIYIFTNPPRINKRLLVLGLSIILVSFLLSFSLGGIITAMICTLSWILFERKIIDRKILRYFMIFVLAMSLCLLFCSEPLMVSGINLSRSFRERLEFNVVAGKMIQSNFLMGVGLNNFFVNETQYLYGIGSTWLLQPVHNVFLLVFSETGILGLLFLYMLLARYINKTSGTKNIYPFLLVIFVLTSSIFDHYWFTIYQNLIVLSFLTGLSIREK